MVMKRNMLCRRGTEDVEGESRKGFDPSDHEVSSKGEVCAGHSEWHWGAMGDAVVEKGSVSGKEIHRLVVIYVETYNTVLHQSGGSRKHGAGAGRLRVRFE